VVVEQPAQLWGHAALGRLQLPRLICNRAALVERQVPGGVALLLARPAARARGEPRGELGAGGAIAAGRTRMPGGAGTGAPASAG
jgi:hypothetical protein